MAPADSPGRTPAPDSPEPYRSAAAVRALAERIRRAATRPWRIMEVCGGQTFTLSRYRLEELLPQGVEMIHGPGCPVCVTPMEVIDQAVELAMRPGVMMCSFGDMLRVPGTSGSLLRAKASGAEVRLLYSPMDALALAAANPEREVVFFAIGFETTMPAYAALVQKADAAGISNLSLLTSLFTVPAAVRAIRRDPECRVDALLAAGHVCAVTGMKPYEELARELGMPVVATGFEPADMLAGILRAVEMLERGEAAADNCYRRVVSPKGNPAALRAMECVLEPCDTAWRGLGVIAGSGMKLRAAYEHFDSRVRFNLNPRHSAMPRPDARGCIASRILRGLARPEQCEAFGTLCTPESPVGAPMVSAEGACAAAWRYR